MNLTASDLIKKSIALYKQNFQLFFTYAFLITLPSLAPALLSVIQSYFLAFQRSSLLESLFIALFVILSIFVYFAILWLSIAKVKVVAERYENQPALSIREEVHSAKKYIFPAFVATLIAGVFILLGFIALIIPGVILSVLFSFVFYAVILDNKKSADALKFSKNLVSGRWWAVLWRLFLPALLFLVLSGLIKSLFGFFMRITDLFLLDTIAAVAIYVVDIFFAPFVIAAQVILYFELKKLKSVTAAPAPPVKTPL